MTQVDTILNNTSIFNDDVCRGDASPEEVRYATNILGYLMLNRCSNDISQISQPSITMYYAGISAFTTLSDIISHASDCSYSIMIYRANRALLSPENVWKAQIDDATLYEELNTASCPLNQYLSLGKTKARAFIIKSGQSKCKAFIVVENPDGYFINRVLGSIPKLLPYLYEDGIIPQDEMELFKAVSSKEDEIINQIINKKCEELNIQEQLIHNMFDGFENISIEERKEQLLRQIQVRKEDYMTYINNAGQKLKQIKEDQINYDALCNFEVNNSNSVTHFLLAHKNIKNPYRYESSFTYAIDETIEYFDDDRFELYFNNSACGFMRSANDKTKIILKGLFLKKYGKIRVYSEFKCDGLAEIRALYTGSIDITYTDHFVHPHLGYYNCLGGNEVAILNYLKEGNWELAIEQTIAATKNINFGDDIVMRRFVSDLNNCYDNDDKYIVVNNGQPMTLKEFVNYVEELEKEEQQEEQKKENE